MTRPSIAAALLAAITEDAPARVRRRLDREPDAAANWTWDASGDNWTIDAGGESVRLKASDGVILSVENVQCSCLLSPRCYHLLSCLSTLPIATESAADDLSSVDSEQDIHTPDSTVPLETAQVEAAQRLFKELAQLLAVGARSAGSLIQAQLMRALHECRNHGLHRLSAGALRVLHHVRQLRSVHDHFDSSLLVDDLAESLELAWRLTSAESVSQEWIGTARRAYFPVEGLSLQALFSEPILAASGHCGVVTYLMGQNSEVYSVSNVRPGEPSRVFEAWQNGIDVGGLSVTHQELSRSGLLLQRGTASIDGRLGAGKDCQAITKPGNGWSESVVERAFDQELDDQIARVFSVAEQSLTTRPAGWDFIFLTGQVAGTDGRSIVFQTVDTRIILLTPALKSDVLRYLSNAEMLSRCPGLPLRIIARLDPSHVDKASPLAIAPYDFQNFEPDASQLPSLLLSGQLTGHVSLGLDQVERSHLTTAEREPVLVPAASDTYCDDGIAPLRRQIRDLALNGRHSLPTRDIGGLARTCAQLNRQSRPTAAVLLQNLASTTIASEASLLGERFPVDPTTLARLWLACTRYISASTSEFQKAQWLMNAT